MNTFAVLALCLAAANASFLPSTNIIQGPSSRSEIWGPDGSLISALAPGGRILHEEEPGQIAQTFPVVGHAESVLAHVEPYVESYETYAEPLVGHHETLVARAEPYFSHQQAFVGHAEPLLEHREALVARAEPLVYQDRWASAPVAYAAPALEHHRTVIAHQTPVVHAAPVITHVSPGQRSVHEHGTSIVHSPAVSYTVSQAAPVVAHRAVHVQQHAALNHGW